MLSKYKFEEVERQECFEDGVNDILYFPITDSTDFPLEIREKAEEIIDCIIHTRDLDTSKLRLNARMIVFSDINGKWINEISIVISDYSTFDGTWIEEGYIIEHDDPLYEPFKAYFMKRLEEILFGV